ncbi:MAG TPA: BON domain-containing protein [Gemmatimonadaceae bacterium]|nr:BON domain-containing protein [Gemmatimonadaceae bacterium]
MKTDAQLQRDVQDHLRWDANTRDAEIGLASKDGVVTLSGQVSSFAQKYSALRAAERVAGVKVVADDLVVRLPSSAARTDTDIAHQVVDILGWDIEVPTDRIKAKVSDGWITLEGEVEWRFERSAAERAVRYLTGVKGVTNLIVVNPKRVSTFEVGQKIKEALRRTAQTDAERVVVEAADGNVTLRGHVRSWAERQDAERAAWSAPGVRSVRDELIVEI